MQADLTAPEAAIDTADFKRVGELAHRCLGLCLVMGAVAPVQRLREIEMAASEENTAALPGLTRHVRRSSHDAIQRST